MCSCLFANVVVFMAVLLNVFVTLIVNVLVFMLVCMNVFVSESMLVFAAVTEISDNSLRPQSKPVTLSASRSPQQANVLSFVGRLIDASTRA